jgi:hypothetical protein
MHVTLNGLPKSWEPFFKGFCARENIPYWKRLWDDYIQEETQEESKSRKNRGSEENLSLVSWTETYSGLHVDLGTHAKCGVEGTGIVRFHLESRYFLEVEYVLYVLELKNNLLSVSVLEDMGFAITFQRGKVLICSEGVVANTKLSIGVRKGRLYRLHG